MSTSTSTSVEFTPSQAINENLNANSQLSTGELTRLLKDPEMTLAEAEAAILELDLEKFMEGMY